MTPLRIAYYSDLLCVWAYVAQPRLEALKAEHGADVVLEHRFVPVFGDALGKLGAAWKDRNGFAGYAHHVAQTVARFPPATLHPDAWTKVRPTSSLSPHLFLRAIEHWERGTGNAPTPRFEQAIWTLRRGFFVDAADISRRDVQRELVAPLDIDLDAVDQLIADGSAHARLAADHVDAEKHRIEGSPTFVLNEGRQKLYGNVGFRIIAANIRELLRTPSDGEASWC